MCYAMNKVFGGDAKLRYSRARYNVETANHSRRLLASRSQMSKSVFDTPAVYEHKDCPFFFAPNMTCDSHSTVGLRHTLPGANG